MSHIIFGLFFLALGIWGVFDEYYYVADFFKGGVPLFLIFVGLLATLAGFIPLKRNEEELDGADERI
jgi:hypothetical protein